MPELETAYYDAAQIYHTCAKNHNDLVKTLEARSKK